MSISLLPGLLHTWLCPPNSFILVTRLLIQCEYCILLLVLSRGLVIKYLRVITSSRLCGDNPANFAVLHTIAYNCQSSSFNDVLVPGCSLFSELFRSRGPFVLPFIGSSVCPPARISSPSSVPSPLVTPSPLLLLLFLIISRGWTLANDHPEGPTSCKWSSITPVTPVTSARIQIQSRGPF